jgi:ribosomal protein S20
MVSPDEGAIAHLEYITESFAGSPIAKKAASLKRLLASANPDRETVQQHLQSFAEAAVKAAQPGITKKKKAAKNKSRKTIASAKAITRSTGMHNRARRGYQTAIFKCLSDYQKCCRDGDWKLCASIMAICISKQVAWAGSAVVAATKYFSGH